MPDVASDTLSLERRVDALRKAIEKLNYDYYILDQPTATDAEYDALLRELREHRSRTPRADHPRVANPTRRHCAARPIQPDSASTADALLSNVYNRGELEAWAARLETNSSRGPISRYVTEPKDRWAGRRVDLRRWCACSGELRAATASPGRT